MLVPIFSILKCFLECHLGKASNKKGKLKIKYLRCLAIQSLILHFGKIFFYNILLVLQYDVMKLGLTFSFLLSNLYFFVKINLLILN